MDTNDFYSTTIPFNISGYPVADSFDLNLFIKKAGIPDTIVYGGLEIIEEFGVDDYSLEYGTDRIVAGHGYIMNVYISEGNIKINNVSIGDKLNSLQKSLNLTLDNRDSIGIYWQDHLLIVETKNQKISKLYYVAPSL